MDVEVNLIGVLLAAVSAMVVGSIWYSRGVFGETWAKLAKVNYEKQMQGNDWTPMVYMFILALVMAYVLAHVTGLSQAFFGKSYLSSAFNSAFWMWLGFMVPATFGNGLFESRRKKLMGLNAGNWLVTLLVMGAVIGYVGV